MAVTKDLAQRQAEQFAPNFDPAQWLENRLKVIKSERGIAQATMSNAEQKLADLDLEQPLVEAAIAKLKS